MNEIIPPAGDVPRASIPSSTTRTRITLAAYTDWLVVICATVLTALDKFDAEWTLGLFIGVAGLMGIMRGMGKSGGATGALLLVAKKFIVVVGMGALLAGCATGSGLATLKVFAPMAVEAIRAAAERRNVTLDEANAFCEEMDFDYGDFDLPGVVVICWTPEASE